jgi:hypothetical protein
MRPFETQPRVPVQPSLQSTIDAGAYTKDLNDQPVGCRYEATEPKATSGA